MRHRLQHKVFAGGGKRSSSLQESRTSSTFTTGKNPHLTKTNKLHSKSTYFYRWSSRASESKTSSLSYLVPSVCTLALLIGGIIALSPILNNVEKVHAEDGIMATSDTPPTISINLTAGDTSASRRTPAEAGKIAYRTDVFTIGGTGIAHYAVSLNTPTGKTGELVGKNNPYATVGKVADNTAPADFAENTWGYAITNDTTTEKVEETLAYSPIPSGMDSSNNGVEVARRMGIDKTTTVADSYKIAFAANLGSNLPADDYMADVYLSVVASPQATIHNITTMQKMNSSLCAASEENETTQLEDTRDHKKYWVTKLKDGNCWMTQNLDFDIPATLSEETSDVTGISVATGISRSTDISNWPSSGNTANLYNNPGDYYYSKHSQDTANSCTGVESLTDAKCNLYKSINPSDTSADNQKNMHYHVGNYYTWDAATVRSRTNAAGDSSYNAAKNAPMSICPKGWKLPTSNNTDSKSFGALMQAYHFTGNTLTTSDGSLFNDPLYFVYGGNLNTTKLYNAGLNGSYWSSTPYSSTDNAYPLSFSNSINLSGTSRRFFGCSVRCVAK